MTPLEPKFPVALIGFTGRLATVQGLAQEMNLPGEEALRFLALLEQKSGVQIPIVEAGGYGWFHLFAVDQALRCLCPTLRDDEVHSLAESYRGLKRENIRQMLEDIFREAPQARRQAAKGRRPTQHGRPPGPASRSGDGRPDRCEG